MRPLRCSVMPFKRLSFHQASLIHADIESAMMDAKGGKVKKRPEALK